MPELVLAPLALGATISWVVALVSGLRMASRRAPGVTLGYLATHGIAFFDANNFLPEAAPHARRLRRAFAAFFGFVLLTAIVGAMLASQGCSARTEGREGPAHERDGSDPPRPASVEPAPPIEAAKPCATDLDCGTCTSAEGCVCDLAVPGADSCPATRDPCFRDPCSDRSASCWAGTCRLRPAPAGPCQADADCEVRDDACLCDVFASLVSAPTDTRCQGRGCGGRPAKNQHQARCDAQAHRCVLDRRAAATEMPAPTPGG